LNSGDNIIFT